MTETTKHQIPAVQLNDSTIMPQLGYGVFKVPTEETAALVKIALESGYRSIDTAKIYENEAGVGEAIRESGVSRSELYITTKLWNDSHAADDARAAFDHSLELLGLDHLDLYLIHWPSPNEHGKYVEAWETLVELRKSGRVTSIGVSNFATDHLQKIIDATSVVPAINQIELHPYFQQHELRAWCAERTIVVEAWSPLGHGGELLKDPVITAIADEVGKTAAQVVIRWHIQQGHVVIPKSATPSRIAQNIDVFDFELTSAHLEQIAALDRGEAGRIGPNPSTAQF
ncbi:MAG: aldo/keto reductase [Gaiellales bacterium]